MSQTPTERTEKTVNTEHTAHTENAGQSATARADQMLNQAGVRIGVFVATARARLQQAAAQIREEADRMDQIKPDGTDETKVSAKNGHTVKPSGTTSHISSPSQTTLPTTERAEQMVDVAAQRMSHFAASVSFNVQKAWARTREEAEDILAEAQAMRQHNQQDQQNNR